MSVPAPTACPRCRTPLVFHGPRAAVEFSYGTALGRVFFVCRGCAPAVRRVVEKRAQREELELSPYSREVGGRGQRDEAEEGVPA